GGYKVVDATGQSLAYVYGCETKGDADTRGRRGCRSYAPVRTAAALVFNRLRGSPPLLRKRDTAATSAKILGERREELEGKLQQLYGLQKDQVRKEVDDWFTSQGF